MNQARIQPDDGKIADFIWGPCESGSIASDRLRRLARFFTYCAMQRLSLYTNRPSDVDPAKEILSAIRLLKSSALIQKDLLLNPTSSGVRSMASIEFVVRTMLMTECESEGTAAIGSANVYHWRGNETLVDYLGRVYTQCTARDIPKDAIDLMNFRCHVLTRHAGIKIQQTEKLSDHLYLRCGPRTKVLLVFSHKAFLEYSRETLKAVQPDLSQNTEQALALGCLPPKLIDETLRTYNLLFPPIGSTRSKKLLRDWVKRERLDESLLNPSFGHSKKDPPRTLHDLYEDFPYWAPQLARLLEEVDDPTPTTRWERYAERRKSHRHTYKCAIAALVVAAVSGTLATLLAAVQVWISYCDWDKNGNKTLC